MKSNKYYTPKIEEFHIGFECEHYHYNRDDGNLNLEKSNYNTIIIKSKQDIPIDDNGCTFFRVKYLDKEDIESLGFKHEGGKLRSGANQIYVKDNIALYHESDEHKICIITRDASINDFYMKTNMDPHKVNFITIKNKSELKKLLKQLDIL